MTRREQLQEQYEDALFALMMDGVATAEGEKLLEENERLKNDPDAAVPEEISKQCLRTIRRHFAKQNVRKAGRFTVKAFGKVAMAAGIAAMLFTVAFATSETVRVNTMNLVVEVFGESTDFYFGGEHAATVAPELTAGWLPEGYILEDQGKDDFDAWCKYRKSEDESIKIKYILSDGTVLSVDTENAEVESIQINGIQAMLVEKNDICQVIFSTVDKSAFVSLVSTGTAREDLIHVARELKY